MVMTSLTKPNEKGSYGEYLAASLIEHCNLKVTKYHGEEVFYDVKDARAQYLSMVKKQIAPCLNAYTTDVVLSLVDELDENEQITFINYMLEKQIIYRQPLTPGSY